MKPISASKVSDPLGSSRKGPTEIYVEVVAHREIRPIRLHEVRDQLVRVAVYRGFDDLQPFAANSSCYFTNSPVGVGSGSR